MPSLNLPTIFPPILTFPKLLIVLVVRRLLMVCYRVGLRKLPLTLTKTRNLLTRGIFVVSTSVSFERRKIRSLAAKVRIKCWTISSQSGCKHRRAKRRKRWVKGRETGRVVYYKLLRMDLVGGRVTCPFWR